VDETPATDVANAKTASELPTTPAPHDSPPHEVENEVNRSEAAADPATATPEDENDRATLELIEERPAAPEASVETTEILVEPPAEVVEARPSERREIIRSATLVMLGNLGSSLIGMVRQSFIAATSTAIAAAFTTGLSPAQKFNDFLVNGSVPGALIPTFNDYAGPDKREELRRLVFTIVNLVALIMALAAVGFLFIAPWFVNSFLASGYTSENKLLTVNFARIIFFSLIALGPFAVLQAALYARKEFGWTAFAASAYHVGIIIGAILTSKVGEQSFGKYGIAFGVILGTVGEIVLLIPGLRNQRLRYMFVLDLKHPAIRRILALYGPVAFSFLLSSALAFLDLSFASQTPCASFMRQFKQCGEANVAAMTFATTLIQFPGGLVAAALSYAVLPTLSTYVREGNMERFKDMLLMGFRLGLLLMIPAAAGLIVLQVPIVGAIFERHGFSSDQTLITASALQNYSYQLPFLAIDQLLIFAFYARKNTIIPVSVLFLSALCYLAVALPFRNTIGMPALAFANTVQNSSHAIFLLIILRWVLGPLRLKNIVPALLKILLATAVMVAVVWGIQQGLGYLSPSTQHSFLGRAVTVVLAGGLGGATYFGVVILLKVEEVHTLKGAVLAKLGKK